MQDMRDFRDAKAMARTVRAALAAKGHKITISESLELIAQAFGVADWNTLSATIRGEASGPRNGAPPPQFPTAGIGFAAFSAALESALHRALAYANQRKHQYATLEHLLLALIDDGDASAAMKACKVDLGALKGNLTSYIDNDLKALVIDDGESGPTAAFQRVIQRAVIAVQSSGREEVTGANVLVAIFAERESHAAYFLQEQDMTRDDAINYVRHGIVKGGGNNVI
jgi:hypothetical protein